MKNFVCILCAFLAGAQLCFAQQADSIGILFWNVENFFDYTDGGKGESDAEFSASGSRHWTKRRFKAKCSAIAKTVFWQAGQNGGKLPDIIALAEVENRRVLIRLLDDTLLRKKDYEIVHFESPDPRGIDVALLYRRSTLKLKNAMPVALSGLSTRDILLTQFETQTGDSLAVTVNHHPSKYGGDETQEKRDIAVEKLCDVCDSLFACGWHRVVAVGDFNEDARSQSFGPLEERLYNMGKDCPDGSIRFDGEWQLIDNAFVRADAFNRVSFKVLRVPFLTVRDNVHSGEKPFRTYSGPRYAGGVSDHYPVWISLKYWLY